MISVIAFNKPLPLDSLTSDLLRNRINTAANIPPPQHKQTQTVEFPIIADENSDQLPHQQQQQQHSIVIPQSDILPLPSAAQTHRIQGMCVYVKCTSYYDTNLHYHLRVNYV